MDKFQKNNLKFILLFFDYLLISFLFFYFIYFRYDYLYKVPNLTTLKNMFVDQYKAYLLYIIFWYLISEFTNFYTSSRFVRYLVYIKKSIYQIILFAFILFTVSGIKSENLFTNTQSILFILILGFYVILTRTSIFFLNKQNLKKGKNLKNILIIGQNDNTENLIALLNKRKEFGLRIIKIFDFNLNTISEIESLISETKIDYAYISLTNNLNEEILVKYTNLFEKYYISVGYIPSIAVETQQILEINYLDSFPILTYKKHPLDNSFNQIVKRIFDLAFTFLAFVFVLWWAFPVIALLVYIYQGGPILFSQKRNGLNGKEFNCLKFRTMRHDKFNNIKPTERNDPRVTKLGRILRKTSLDELPQFINVLKGDMSIVGPRPHMVSENQSYADIIKRYSLRHYVKPGITGLAQVKGHRGAVDTEKDMEMRIRSDIYYVRNWSFLLDLLIIYKTIKLMILGDENAI